MKYIIDTDPGIDDAIAIRDQQIDKLQSAYDKLQTANIEISNSLLMENNFTEAQLIRLSAFIKEDELHIDDIIETVNHFKCIDYIIDCVNERLDERIIKDLHRMLKYGTQDSSQSWFSVGDYKKLPNEVGGNETTKPELVRQEMKELLKQYNFKKEKSLDDILDFHYHFERIHPFQDGNGRVGRLIMFKECLANKIIPFVITDDLKYFYYRGLSQWEFVREYLRDTCLTAQDNYKKVLEYFRVNKTTRPQDHK